jgi:hypothetical protein
MPDQERINNAADPIYQEFPGVSPFDTSPRVGLRKSELEDPKVQRELDGVKTRIDAIVEERMAGFDERNPDAPPEDRAIAEAGTRALVDRLLNLPKSMRATGTMLAKTSFMKNDLMPLSRPVN